ncbi:MAG: hypothetical protein KGM97_10035, partial [Alphaproteobacteria bacterium]|nr:hypothetical protein [Alphaproteobacteria bacterium]
WGQFSYALGEGKAWPEGRYRIDLLVNDQMAASTNFRVAGHATPTGSNAPPSASGPQTYADATLGYRLKMPAEWVRDETTTDRLLLVNAAEGIKLDIILASDAAPQSDSTVFHTQENLNRNNPDIEMLAGYSRFFPAVSRVGYCMEMHMRPKDLIEFLVILPRGRSGTNTDYYAMKVYGPPARKDAIEHAVDQFIAGFEIDNQ